ncbi:MAG: pyridoxamine 5'-phosphate oxidase family protein [Candidatus Limnocylindrales bacterium]
MIWTEFEAAAPELAAAGRERFQRTGVALLGTLRRDGSPRISPVEPSFVLGHLLFGVMRSKKSSDLSRDARCTLHSSVSDPNGTEGEFKLFGRASLVTDAALRDGEYEAWWKSYPPEAARLYSLDISSAALVEWHFDAMSIEVVSWSERAGLVRNSARYP